MYCNFKIQFIKSLLNLSESLILCFTHISEEPTISVGSSKLRGYSKPVSWFFPAHGLEKPRFWLGRNAHAIYFIDQNKQIRLDDIRGAASTVKKISRRTTTGTVGRRRQHFHDFHHFPQKGALL
jgi:hypothetical protein